jgi:hypothetical protein
MLSASAFAPNSLYASRLTDFEFIESNHLCLVFSLQKYGVASDEYILINDNFWVGVVIIC